MGVFFFFCCTRSSTGFPGGTVVKSPLTKTGNGRDIGSIPGLGRCPGIGNGNPLQYYCLENSMDRGAWQATVHGVAKSRTRLSNSTATHQRQKHRCVGPEHRPTVLYLSEYVGPSSFLSALCGSLCSAPGWAEKRTGLPETVLQEIRCYIRQPSSPNYSLT